MKKHLPPLTFNEDFSTLEVPIAIEISPKVKKRVKWLRKSAHIEVRLEENDPSDRHEIWIYAGTDMGYTTIKTDARFHTTIVERGMESCPSHKVLFDTALSEAKKNTGLDFTYFTEKAIWAYVRDKLKLVCEMEDGNVRFTLTYLDHPVFTTSMSPEDLDEATD